MDLGTNWARDMIALSCVAKEHSCAVALAHFLQLLSWKKTVNMGLAGVHSSMLYFTFICLYKDNQS